MSCASRSITAVLAVAVPLLLVVGASGCEGPDPPASPPCNEKCQDGIAMRAMRETMKLVFNLTLQGKDVGTHDETIPCLRGGSAHVFGEATSNALQGTTEVKLTYELTNCTYLQRDDEAPENFEMTFSGRFEQSGSLAVSSGATTAIYIKGQGVSAKGTVYDPPLPYEATGCALEVSQNGNHLGGDFCGRAVGVDF